MINIYNYLEVNVRRFFIFVSLFFSINEYAYTGVHQNKLSGFGNDGTGLSVSDVAGSVAVAIVLDCRMHNAMQMKAIADRHGLSGVTLTPAAISALPDASCIGNRTRACAPRISSQELRAIIQGSVNMAELGIDTFHKGDFTSLANTNCPISYTQNIIRRAWQNPGNTQNGVQAAINEFMDAGQIGGFSCGLSAVEPSRNGYCDDTGTDDDDSASILNCIAQGGEAGNSRAHIGFVHVTELDNAPATIGFAKLDGISPSLANSLSGNYPLMSNIIGSGTLPADINAMGMTLGVVSGPVVYHAVGATYQPAGCGSLISEDGAIDLDDGLE